MLASKIAKSIVESFSGRVSVVTGAGGGIGRAVSVMLAEKGSAVVAADLNAANADETRGMCQQINPGSLHISCNVNVAEKQSVDQVFETIQKTYAKPATILVNCAGILRDNFLLEMSEEDFDKVIDVNLKGTFLMTKLACARMVECKVSQGSIVNISSVSGKIGNIGQCNYSASKAAIESFTRTVAKEMAKHNIRCNAVMPGFIDTQILSTVPQKLMEKLIPQIPARRLGKPEEIAEAIVFLSSERSSYITGSTLQISGGLFV